jgi:hypothetical protein
MGVERVSGIEKDIKAKTEAKLFYPSQRQQNGTNP